MKRNITIDYLKIFSMILVILYHVTIYGIDYEQLARNDIIIIILNIVKSISIICVNCFILISGYFMYKSTINLKKIFRLWLQVEIYSIGIYLILCVIPEINISFNGKTFIRMLFPVLSNQYWFFTNYLLLIIVAPILNIIIRNVTKQTYEKILFVGIFVFSILPTINIFGDPFGTNKGFSIIWFVILYLIAAYIRMYPLPRARYGRIYFTLTILLFIVITSCYFFSSIVPYVMIVPNLLLTYNSIIVVGASLAIFLMAVASDENKQYKNGRIISKIATLSFGVYLLHEHPQIRELLWNQCVRLMDYVNNPVLFLIRIVLSVIIIFVIGIVVNFIVAQIVKKITFCFDPLLDKIMTRIRNKF